MHDALPMPRYKPGEREANAFKISVTPGSIVSFRPRGAHGPTLGAFVAKVNADDSVNLSVCSEDGGWFGVSSVRFLQDNDVRLEYGEPFASHRRG